MKHTTGQQTTDKKDHSFCGELAKILVEGGQIIMSKHDRKEWLYLIKVAAKYQTQLAEDGRKAKFIRCGEDNTVHGEYYCGLVDAKKYFLQEVEENRRMNYLIQTNSNQ